MMDCVCDVLIVYACGLVAKDGVCICARLTAVLNLVIESVGASDGREVDGLERVRK